MDIINLTINRIIIHQIFRRDSEGTEVPPIQNHDFTRFDQNAMSEFKSRVVDALGNDSKAVPMEAVSRGTNNIPALVNLMVEQDDATFATSSFDIATKLNDAQNSRNIPGGIIVIFTGIYGANSKKFFGIIKAEIHSAYEKEIDPQTREISLKFVEEALLTPSNRLYKTAGFFEKNNYDRSTTNLNDKWQILVSDYQINKSGGKAAAQYFYSSFLGCGYPETSARMTKKFYEATNDFISDLDIPEEEKSGYMNALVTYIKVNKSSAISASEFAGTYFDVDTRDNFIVYMSGSDLPTTAFTKDIEHIKDRLKTRKIKFKNNVKITAPANIFSELIEIKTIDGDLNDSEVPQKWTKIIIKDTIIKQE